MYQTESQINRVDGSSSLLMDFEATIRLGEAFFEAKDNVS